MLNKKMIEKFKQINDIIHFNFYYFETFDEFVNSRIENINEIENYLSYNYLNCKCYKKFNIKNKIEFFKNEMKCNNENTIVFANRVSNCDCDDYLLINFENDNMFLTSNDEQIENYNDDVTKNILYEMLKLIFESRKYCYNHELNVINENDDIFKCVENTIDDCDFFQFYYFDDFINFQIENIIDDEFDDDAIEYNKTTMQNIETLKTKYHCNNDNTIILLYRCDDDEYLLLNFETNDKIIMQNVDIEHVNDNITNDALYYILCDLFTNEYCCM